ncbi:hypothetical protein BIFBIF_00688 [Bifidobacterium bifidum ATCC 29521 = JCM 1255 = DSM 20456]|nr:hypothetical protein BIFBIF_00688 [Bifidobacterium bifidum ATCC 29521 = JCM 1255 = DSM 20456]
MQGAASQDERRHLFALGTIITVVRYGGIIPYRQPMPAIQGAS